MSEPTELSELIEAVEDAFSHAHGRPTFEPGLNSSPDASDGEVRIQKACRLLDLATEIESVGPYYGTRPTTSGRFSRGTSPDIPANCRVAE